MKLMGEPIKQLGFDPNDENNWCDGTRAKFHVRVKGPKDKGCDFVQFTIQLESKLMISEIRTISMCRTRVFLGHN